MEEQKNKCEKCKWRWEMSKEHCNKCKNNPHKEEGRRIDFGAKEEDNFEGIGDKDGL